MTRRKLMPLAAGLVLALTLVQTTAQGSDRDDLVRQKEQQTQQMESIQSELEGVDVNLQKVYMDLQETRGKLPGAQAELANAQAEVATAQREQEAVGARLDAAQGELETIGTEIKAGEEKLAQTRDQIGEIARAQYRGETTPSTVELLVGSQSSEDFLTAFAANETAQRVQSVTLTEVSQTTASNRMRQQRQTAVESEIGELKAKADQALADKKQKEQAATEKKQALDELEASISDQQKALEGQKDAFQASLNQMAADRDSTAAQIAAIDAENARKAAEEARQRQAAAAAPRSGGGGGGGGRGGSAPNTGQQIIPPISGPLYVTSPFGWRIYPFDGQRWFHNGVDLRSACGNPQFAASDGTVSAVRPAAGNGTHGNQVILNLGNINGSSYVAVYNHLSGFNVSVGQRVSRGDIIGWTGQTGMVTGCHVHFEIWKDGQVIDPMTLPGF
ncbi:M23 family metallopeptidase [Actinobaculum suis]|uniref:M23 family metallopeptidase n=1 Tax=Actinobaculum suis TaxID=1657 RepID=UPI000A87CC59|nr:M23 family metallopeptidase [Actinobaculum suis]